MFCFCFFSTFEPIFHFKLGSFCCRGGCKNTSCPMALGYPSTPLPRVVTLTYYYKFVESFLAINAFHYPLKNTTK